VSAEAPAHTGAGGAASAGGVSVRRWSASTRVGSAALLLLAAAAVVAPYVLPSATVFRLITLCVLIVLAVMWNLLAGYGGMVSVGQQAYLGLGAYALVALSDTLGVDPFLAVPLVAVLGALLAVPVSFLAFRLVGGYFAIGTWVIAEVARLLTVQVDTLGAGSGTSLRALAGTDRVVRIAVTYWLALAVAVAAVGLSFLVVRSRLGLALTAIRDDPTAAASNGVDVVRTKRLVFALSGGGCAAAGAVLALQSLRVQPDSIFSVQWTAFMIFMVVIGGVGTLEGPLVGAVVFFLLQEQLADFGSTYLVLLGLVAVAVVLVAPQGLWGLLTRGRWGLFPVAHRVVRRPAP